MDFTFKIDGLDRIEKATKEVQIEINKQLNIALVASAAKVHAEASKSLTNGQKSGALYKRGTKTHQASAAGEAPASDTGTLLNSLSFYNFRDKLEAVITTRLKYAAMLEFGTAKIGARPFMMPAYIKSKEWIGERLNKAVRDGVIKATRK